MNSISAKTTKESEKEDQQFNEEKTNSTHTLRRYPWRVAVENFDNILEHDYENKGTKEEPIYLVDFLPNDLENPMQYSEWYKWAITAFAAIATLAVAAASSAYSGAVSSIALYFGESDKTRLTLGVSLFVLGFAIGPLCWAPLSELFGRKNTFLASFAFLTLFNGLAIISPNLDTLIALRFLAGSFGCASLINGGGTVADLHNGEKRGLGMALFASAPFLGPTIGPITSGFLSDAYGWKSVFVFLTIFTGAILLLGVFLPETYSPILLRQRAARLTKITGKTYVSRIDFGKDISAGHQFSVAIKRPIQLLIWEPIVSVLSIYVAIIYALLYSFFSAFPIVFQQNKGWSPGIGGLSFIGIAVGVIGSVLYIVVFENPRYIRIASQSPGVPPAPEVRLLAAKVGAPAIVISLAGFAGTDGFGIHWFVPIFFSVFFGFGMVNVFLSLSSYLIDSYVIYAASVLAANSVVRSLFGMAFPLFTPQMYAKLGVHWAPALCCLLALICLPAPFLLDRYGKVIRSKSKYAAEAAAILEMMLKGSNAKYQDEDHPTEVAANMELGMVRTNSNLSRMTSIRPQESRMTLQNQQRLSHHEEENSQQGHGKTTAQSSDHSSDAMH